MVGTSAGFTTSRCVGIKPKVSLSERRQINSEPADVKTGTSVMWAGTRRWGITGFAVARSNKLHVQVELLQHVRPQNRPASKHITGLDVTEILPISVRWWNQAQSFWWRASSCLSNNLSTFIDRLHNRNCLCSVNVCCFVRFCYDVAPHLIIAFGFPKHCHNHSESNTALQEFICISVHTPLPQRTGSSRSMSLCWWVALRSEVVLDVLSPFGCQALRHHRFSLYRHLSQGVRISCVSSMSR